MTKVTDDDNSSSGDALSGTSWEWTDSYYSSNYYWKETVTLTFKTGGNGTIVIKDEDSYYGTEIETNSFTYTYNSRTKTGTIKARKYDSYRDQYTNVTYDFEVDGNKLYFYDDEEDIVFTRK